MGTGRRELVAVARSFGVIAAGLLLVAGCSSSGSVTAATTSTANYTNRTLETLPNNNNSGPATSNAGAAPTTAAPTTTTAAPLPAPNGTFELVGEPLGEEWSSPPSQKFPGLSPRFEWNVTLEPSQRVVFHGPSLGSADEQLSTVSMGVYYVCPGTVTGKVCKTAKGKYDYTLDVFGADGLAVASKTITMKVTT